MSTTKYNKRTDCHRPGAIIPANYRHVLHYNGATVQDGGPIPSYGVDCEMDKRAKGHAHDGECCCVGLLQAGRKIVGNTGTCGVCGTHFVYGEIWQHVETKEYLHVGHICGRKYGLLVDRSAFELAAGRAAAAAATACLKAQRAEALAAYLSDKPELAAAFELREEHYILADIYKRLREYGQLSEAQIALCLKLAHQIRNPAPEEVHVPAPITANRQVVEGEIVAMKEQESHYGYVTKMLVKISTPGGVWLTWGTRPSGHNLQRGDRVRFKARLAVGKEAHFCFFSRPTQVEVLSAK